MKPKTKKNLTIDNCHECKHYEDYKADRGCMTCKKTGRIFLNPKGEIPTHCQLKDVPSPMACTICGTEKRTVVMRMNMVKGVRFCQECYSRVADTFFADIRASVILPMYRSDTV